MIPELDTEAGRPRILVIERKDANALPALVIESSASPTSLRTFGPLSRDALSARINSDIIRWSTGNEGCGAGR